ncbi:hypothetical protein B0H13DRAFT_1195526 [Mycena leptocephala]|nr:hypothetical protein B0H13DRAFT_1195526 [Mycena leptocephala]
MQVLHAHGRRRRTRKQIEKGRRDCSPRCPPKKKINMLPASPPLLSPSAPAHRTLSPTVILPLPFSPSATPLPPFRLLSPAPPRRLFRSAPSPAESRFSEILGSKWTIIRWVALPTRRMGRAGRIDLDLGRPRYHFAPRSTPSPACDGRRRQPSPSRLAPTPTSTPPPGRTAT